MATSGGPDDTLELGVVYNVRLGALNGFISTPVLRKR